MITVPVWFFTAVCSVACLAIIAAAIAFNHAQDTVDRILDQELRHLPWCDHPDCYDHTHLDGVHFDEHGRPFRGRLP